MACFVRAASEPPRQLATLLEQRERAQCTRHEEEIATGKQVLDVAHIQVEMAARDIVFLVNGLYRHLEEMEASYLLPGIECKRHETEKLRAINEALRDVIRRKEEHLARMQATLAQFRTEREALNAELERILAPAAQSA